MLNFTVYYTVTFQKENNILQKENDILQKENDILQKENDILQKMIFFGRRIVLFRRRMVLFSGKEDGIFLYIINLDICCNSSFIYLSLSVSSCDRNPIFHI
ncbi:hypothetical protein ASJ81_06090 [Methanosarcina spelaei]|uniref:Uncharacterized protein n=1 Tax=Methanosarcina spelaei TaxID=1036679 RepID=A0A2A2HTS7_9EURY|nr:hypothetical protein ASJ81_06090 [Methanosarcina spelaei]